MAEHTFYRAVGGITDGMSFHTEGTVFPGTETLDANFAATGGKVGDRVLFEKASATEYRDYRASLEPDLGSGAPYDTVGFAPVGEDSLLPSQLDEDGKAVKAGKDAGKPADGEPVPTDSDEAQRRLEGAGADTPVVGAGDAKATASKQ